MNVTELVFSYLKAIKRIAEDPVEYALYVPDLESNAIASFVNALNSVPNEISELCEAAETRKSEEEEELFSRGEIEAFPSSSAYIPDDVLNISLALD